MFSLKDPKVMSLLTHTNFVCLAPLIHFALSMNSHRVRMEKLEQMDFQEMSLVKETQEMWGTRDHLDHLDDLYVVPFHSPISPSPLSNLPISLPGLFFSWPSPVSLFPYRSPTSHSPPKPAISLFSTTNPLISLQSPPSILHLSLTPTGSTR